MTGFSITLDLFLLYPEVLLLSSVVLRGFSKTHHDDRCPSSHEILGYLDERGDMCVESINT